MKFELSRTIAGHKADVRAVCATGSGNLVTASRDCTAKLWEYSKEDHGFEYELTYEDHTNFVCAVCVVTDGSDREFVVTGSNDKIIRVFEISGSRPLLLLVAHNDTVCCVTPGILPGTVISTSWDKTAALWNVFDDFREPSVVLTGHEASVWAAVQMVSGVIVTASADKSLKIWEPKGKLIDTLHGHLDCVRSLAVHTDTTVLSCSNDASVKLWNVEEHTCLGTWYGHENYIYSVILTSYDENLFVTCGEDASLKIWNQHGCIQTIYLPSQSAWCVTCLPNGDIAVGLSDGTVRIFTRSRERVAAMDEVELFDSQVNSRLLSLKSKIGKISRDELPGPEALITPGSRDGQTKLISDGDTVWCYKWTSAQQKWEKMGQVVGSDNGSGKELHSGQEYDYVFNIDVEDGKPPLKLPYNIGEDPWVIAQKFVHEHNLSQTYLDSVANYIIRNTENSDHKFPLGASDPFTGDGRYIPPPADEPNVGLRPHGEPDHVAGDTDMLISPKEVAVGEYFPQRTCVSFNVFNKSVIEDKIFANNNQMEDRKLDIELVDDVTLLLDGRLTDDNQINTLIKMLYWPEELLVPVLDLVRVAVRSKPVFQKLFSIRDGRDFLTVIDRYIQPDNGTDVLHVLALRTVCNIMLHEEGWKLFLKHKESILTAINKYKKPYSKHIQMAMATILLNLSVAANQERDVTTLTGVALAIVAVLPHIKDTEANFRALVSLGTCIWNFNDQVWEEPLLLIKTSAQTMEIIKQTAAGGGGAPSSVSDEKRKCLEKLHACSEELLRKLLLTSKKH